MLHEIDKNILSGAKSNSVKIRIFRGATIDDIKDFLKPYLKRSPTNITLHVGTSNSINDSSSVILNKLLSLISFIHTELLESNVILSDIQDTGNQMNTLHAIRLKNANRLIIGHLNMNSLRN